MISFEPLVGILRFHPTGEFGDPYTFVCTVVLDKDVAVLKGASGSFTREVYRQLRTKLLELGIKKAYYERKKTDRWQLRL